MKRLAFAALALISSVASAQVHALQDATKIEQPGGPGRLEIPVWDPVSHKKVRDALLVLASTLPDRERLELHGAPLSPTARNPQRKLEIPRRAAARLNVRSEL